MFRDDGQIHKVDVWSFFVTMLWILGVGEIRQRSDQFKFDADVQHSDCVRSGYGLKDSRDGDH